MRQRLYQPTARRKCMPSRSGKPDTGLSLAAIPPRLRQSRESTCARCTSSPACVPVLLPRTRTRTRTRTRAGGCAHVARSEGSARVAECRVRVRVRVREPVPAGLSTCAIPAESTREPRGTSRGERHSPGRRAGRSRRAPGKTPDAARERELAPCAASDLGPARAARRTSLARDIPAWSAVASPRATALAPRAAGRGGASSQ